MRVAKDQRIEGGIDELKGLVDQQGSKIGSLVFSVAAIQDRLEALAKKSPESVAEDLSLIANSTASANIQIQELSTANTTLSEMLKRQGEITRQWYEGNDWNPNVFIPRKLNPSLFPATDPNPPVPSEQPSTIKKSADKN